MDLLRIISFKCWASAHFHTKINHYTITHHKKISLATQRLPLIHEKKRLNTSSNLSGYLPYAPWLLVEERIPWMCINVSIYHKKNTYPWISLRDCLRWWGKLPRIETVHLLTAQGRSEICSSFLRLKQTPRMNPTWALFKTHQALRCTGKRIIRV